MSAPVQWPITGLFWLALTCCSLWSCSNDWDCGDRCMLGGRCVDGVSCICPAGTLQCGSNDYSPCTSLSSDPENCGACGTECADGATCVDGQCQACPEGTTLCEGWFGSECVALDNDPENCGACDNECDDDLRCFDGTCELECDDGLTFCVEVLACIDLDANRDHCGQCGEACPVETDTVCAAGACVCQDAGLTVCGDQCVDTTTDEAHCGGCDTLCGPYAACIDGQCVCPDGVTTCGDACSDLVSDPRHCGACDATCAPGEECVDGTCSCLEPRTSCGDACALVGDASAHCTGCDQPCSGACAGGACLGVRSVHTGVGLSCTLFDTGEVSCWGMTSEALDEAALAPRAIVPLPESAVSLTVGDWHACALTMSGAVWCWGRNDKGQLGRGASSSLEGPGAVITVSTAAEIAAGSEHVCARLTDGRGLCWGQAPGIANGMPTSTPVPIFAERAISSLVVGGDSTCARFIDDADDIACFGLVESLTDSLTIVPASLTVRWGGQHGCFIEDGEVKCLGKCDTGACGTRTSRAQSGIPRTVDGVLEPVAVDAGNGHSCAVDREGVVWCWGANDVGQLGRGVAGDISAEAAPARFPALALGVSVGHDYTCAHTESRIWCWGQGEQGQLGHGIAEQIAFPVEVQWW